MTALEERPAGAVVSAYGLRQPGPADLRRSIDRIYGEDAEHLWCEVCAMAGVSNRPDPSNYRAIVDVMFDHPDGAVRLCAESFLIRINAFEHLFNAETIVRSTS